MSMERRYAVPIGPGTAQVHASFGASTKASTALEVLDTVLSRITSVQIETDTDAESTLNLLKMSTQPLRAHLNFSNGATAPSIAAAGWMSIKTLLTIYSDAPGFIAVDSFGNLTLLDNWPRPIILQASLKCNAAVKHAIALKANLLPAEFDVDAGGVRNFQFLQEEGLLAVPLRVHVPAGHRLINFQIVVSFDSSRISSSFDKKAGGRAYFTQGAWGNAGMRKHYRSNPFQRVRLQTYLVRHAGRGTKIMSHPRVPSVRRGDSQRPTKPVSTCWFQSGLYGQR